MAEPGQTEVVQDVQPQQAEPSNPPEPAKPPAEKLSGVRAKAAMFHQMGFRLPGMGPPPSLMKKVTGEEGTGSTEASDDSGNAQEGSPQTTATPPRRGAPRQRRARPKRPARRARGGRGRSRGRRRARARGQRRGRPRGRRRAPAGRPAPPPDAPPMPASLGGPPKNAQMVSRSSPKKEVAPVSQPPQTQLPPTPVISTEKKDPPVTVAPVETVVQKQPVVKQLPKPVKELPKQDTEISKPVAVSQPAVVSTPRVTTGAGGQDPSIDEIERLIIEKRRRQQAEKEKLANEAKAREQLLNERERLTTLKVLELDERDRQIDEREASIAQRESELRQQLQAIGTGDGGDGGESDKIKEEIEKINLQIQESTDKFNDLTEEYTLIYNQNEELRVQADEGTVRKSQVELEMQNLGPSEEEMQKKREENDLLRKEMERLKKVMIELLQK